MERADILKKISEKICSIREDMMEITEDGYLDFRGAGLNSIEVLSLLIYLEDIYGIEISDENLILSRYVYVKDIIDVVILNEEEGNEK